MSGPICNLIAGPLQLRSSRDPMAQHLACSILTKLPRAATCAALVGSPLLRACLLAIHVVAECGKVSDAWVWDAL